MIKNNWKSRKKCNFSSSVSTGRKLLAGLAVCFVLLAGAVMFSKLMNESPNLPEEMIGSWSCEPLASDDITVTDFYAMYINADGSFSLYDTVGNPGIAGKMKRKENSGEDPSRGAVRISCGSEDFDPPQCWNMSEKDDLEYEIIGKGKIRLGHNGVWLSFYDADMTE